MGPAARRARTRPAGVEWAVVVDVVVLPRRVLGVLSVLGLAGMMAFPAAGPVAAEPAAGYTWTVTDPKDRSTMLQVSPLDTRFRFEMDGEEIAEAVVPSMQISSLRVSWKWSDPQRLCPPVDGQPERRCPVSVWATLDRLRGVARVTLFQRTRWRTIRRNIVVTGQSFDMPRPDDESVSSRPYRLTVITIRDFTFQPRRVVLASPDDRISFVNEGTRTHSIAFDRAPTDNRQLCPVRPACWMLRPIPAGRFSADYPSDRSPIDPDTDEPVPAWAPGTYSYSSREYPFMTGVVVVPED